MQKALHDEIEKMKIALQEAIADAESVEEITYGGFDGQLLSKAGGNYTYQFTLKTYWDIDDNAKIYVIDQERALKVDARVLSREAMTLMIVTKMLLPQEHLAHLLFLEDKVWLLKRQLSALTTFNETAAEFGAKTLGLLPSTSGKKAVRGKLGQFTPHPSQEKAIAHGLGSEVTIIVGPPGTGKTATLSDLICRYLRQGLSVLLVSHTNIATDNAFIRLIQAMKESRKTDLRVLAEQGLAVRAGDPRHVALRSGAYREFTVNALAEARTGRQREERERLEKALQELDRYREACDAERQREEVAWYPRREKLQAKIVAARRELTRLQSEQVERQRQDQEFVATKAQQRKEASTTLARLQQEYQGLVQARADQSKIATEDKRAWEEAVKVDEQVRAMGRVKRWFSPYSGYDFAEAERTIARLREAKNQAGAQVKNLDKLIYDNQMAQISPSVQISHIDDDMERFNRMKALGDHPDVVRMKRLEGQVASQEEKIRQGEQKIDAMRERGKRQKEERDQMAAHIEDLKGQQEMCKQQIMEEAQLVATTITSVYLNSNLLEREFDVVVIDEVSMISIIGVLLAASRATQHLVGGGDPMQLAPIVKLEHEDQAPHAKEWLSTDLFTYLQISIFDAINGAKNCVLLTQQGRTHPTIVAPISHYVYQDMVTNREETAHAPGVAPHSEWPLILADTTNTPAQCLKPSKSKPRENEYHAVLAGVLARQALESLPPRSPGDDPSIPRVAIIAPYRSQVQLIQRKLRATGISHLVHVGTINTVQSLEFTVVIFDTVEAPGMKPWAFTFDRILDDRNMATDATRKLNVAWTRARSKLIVIAHRRHLHTHLPRLHPDDDPAKKQRLLVELVDWAAREGYIDAAEAFESVSR